MVVICTFEALIKFITNNPTFRPLWATVLCCGVTGKSFIVNTLISMVRRYTKWNDMIRFDALTGSAAYIVGGCTLHFCLNLSIDLNVLKKDLSTNKQEELVLKIEHMLMLIIDK